ncbi:MAG TPA: TIGR00730 family Rossman fold protein, partial [Rectinemataceae bacterium]
VFCGSAESVPPVFIDAARDFGTELGKRGISLVYGGGDVGTMGVLAKAAMDAGSRVIGIIPEKLNAMVDHLELSELIVVADMHQRKALMQKKAQAFAVLPGGIGTMEEFFEVWTWRYIGYHSKPVGILNVGGFYNGLLDFLSGMRKQGFVAADVLEDLSVETSGSALIASLERKLTSPSNIRLKIPERQKRPTRS